VGAVEPKAAEAQGDADKIAAVDAAYPFESATDGFKLWLHESLNKADYSPFVTAKAMDEAVKRHGATVEWDKALAALDDVGHAVASLEAAWRWSRTTPRSTGPRATSCRPTWKRTRPRASAKPSPR